MCVELIGSILAHGRPCGLVVCTGWKGVFTLLWKRGSPIPIKPPAQPQ